MDVADFKFPRDPSGRVHLKVHEANGESISAYSASDGTLRFLGMLGALLNEDAEGLYFFEEIDNGIHPARLHLLLDLIERQTAKGKIQVIATTHSPDVLNLINDTTFENTVCGVPRRGLCRRRHTPGGGATQCQRIAEISGLGAPPRRWLDGEHNVIRRG